MNESRPDDSARRTSAPPDSSRSVGASPYATGGGGITFERKVAVQFLAHMLAGTSVGEVAGARRVVRVAFQQAPFVSADDIVLDTALPDEPASSLVIALAVRREPKFVQSDKDARKLIRQLVQTVVADPADELNHRLGLVVAGPQTHAEQLSLLAEIAAKQTDARRFFRLVATPGKFDATIRSRLDHLCSLVQHTLEDLGECVPARDLVEQRTWRLLTNLVVHMPRLETPYDTDWTRVADTLMAVVPDADPAAAFGLRDRLVALANDYAPAAAEVALNNLRRDVHDLLDTTKRRHRGWRTLDSIHTQACDWVRGQVTGPDGRSVRLDRTAATARLRDAVSGAEAVVVSGESGVGKSALVVLAFADDDSKTHHSQSVVVNLRQLPDVGLSLETALGDRLSVLLSELSAPQRVLVVDSAEAAVENRHHMFRYLIGAARESDVKVVAVTTAESKQFVVDILGQQFDTDVVGFEVPSLTDAEIDQLVRTFSELQRLHANARSRELLRRLVVVDLLVRAGVTGTPLTDADAMNEIWSGLVRRPGRGFPDARETAMLKLVELELGDRRRLDVLNQLDPAALHGLQLDGLLRRPVQDPFRIGPEFAHDELRRYALARLLLADGDPAGRLLQAGAPRWTLSAARLACQVVLALPDAAAIPLKGRMTVQQAAFDQLVGAGHGSRWGDVPGEAMLALSDYKELLRSVWPQLLADEAAGLRRLTRLVDQRLRNDAGVVDATAVAPIVSQLLEAPTPWRSGDYITDLLRGWLRALAIARTGPGDTLRVLLRQRLIAWCTAADRQLAAEREQERREGRDPARSAPGCINAAWLKPRRTLMSRLTRRRKYTRQPRNVPWELKDEVVVEFLALLGPDLGDEGEAILARLAKDAPAFLGPAVDGFFSAVALATGRPGLLAELTEAYYVDDENNGLGLPDDGIRRHRWEGLLAPHAAWHRGPFLPMLQSNFRNGVAVLNRLLNHAARTRVGTLVDIDRRAPWRTETIGRYGSKLALDGERRRYLGDAHVWRWYRGGAVGPYPCVSALQGLERECERLIEAGLPLGKLIPILLDGCENLAMVGLAVGILVRHAEAAERLLDPFIAEPLVWHLDAVRAAEELSPMVTRTEDLPKQDRRRWSLQQVAMVLVLQGRGDRLDDLRSLGDTLVRNARRLARGAKRGSGAQSPFAVEIDRHQLILQARAWASTLDRDTYKASATNDGVIVESTPPTDVVAARAAGRAEAEAVAEAIRLFVKYHVRPSKDGAQPVVADELVTDLAAARRLLDNPPPHPPHRPADVCALLAAAALEAHFVAGHPLPEDTLLFAAEVALQIGEASPSPQDVEDMLYDYGADRSASRAVALLLLPAASGLCALLDQGDGSTAFDRAVRAGVNLARTPSYEVRLHLARGLDQLWKTPCAKSGLCQHEAGWRLATETMRHCALGPVDSETGRRPTLRLEDPLGESLAHSAANTVIVSRLDGAMRALAPAAAAGACVSADARELLTTLLAAQRRSLLASEDPTPDERGTHSLVAARALLTLAADGDEATIVEYINAYADNSALIDNLLRALSAAAEEAPDRAATAQRVWPRVIRRILELHDAGRKLFTDLHYGDRALASVIPIATGEIPYLYREIGGQPITWWNPEALRPEVEAWLVPAAGNGMCADQLVWFLAPLAPEGQVRLALPWMERLVLADPESVAKRAAALPAWLVDIGPAAAEAGLSSTWQAIVDALVVAGVQRLAPYSD